MIAIPVEYSEEEYIVPSKLFGNALQFALFDNNSLNLSEVVTNTGSGNGIATAKFLIGKGVDQALYSYLGDGPFGTLMDAKAKVFYMGKTPDSVQSVLEALKADQLPEVTPDNAKELLDPGTAAGSCECGCSHD